MTDDYVPPDVDLTPNDHLRAELVRLDQAVPGGYQVALSIRLTKAIEQVETFFAEHDLPSREELIAELTLWRCHAEDGMTFARRCDTIMDSVLRRVPR